MKFKNSLNRVKLDFSKLILLPGSGTSGISPHFEISPKEFLRYAKDDLHSNKDQGKINGLTNAKRAIDCQIDEVLNCLGLDYHCLPKSLEPFINYFNFKDDISYKLKIIQGLNLAPGLLISKSRNLRNKLEHFYKSPSVSEVKEAIDIADLLIRSIEGKLKLPTNEFMITDEHNFIEGFDFLKGYIIYFNFQSREFDISETFKHIESEVVDLNSHHHTYGDRFKVSLEDSEFYGFIRLMNSIDDDFEITESFKLIAHLIGHPMPVQHIKARS